MSAEKRPCNSRADWARPTVDRNWFEHEQVQLGRVWNLLGLATDIPNDGDWFRASLGGRSVFVQRFGDDIRGFENVCAHRFYPLRTKNKGNGPIRCGFHHWQYNKDGLAVGIPKCPEMFDVTPRELGARLTPIEVTTCGCLIFGRFPSDQHTETLEQSFGEAFVILQSMCNIKRSPPYIETRISANWRLVYHITLDDYHIVAVHPDTFGKDGYLATDAVRYYRIGQHSAYFHGKDEGDLTQMANECRRGSYCPTDYRIFQFFPNLLAAHIEAANNWYVLLQQYLAVAPNRCISRCWYFPAPFPPTDKSWLHNVIRRAAAPLLPFALPFYIRKTFSEDNRVCEQIQTVAPQIKGFPILGRHEERIAWFEKTYRAVVGDAQADPSVTIDSANQKR